MYAMELNGSHVGRKVKLKWQTPKAKSARSITGVIKIVHHHPAGHVSIKPPHQFAHTTRLYSGYKTYRIETIWDKAPGNAEVEFLDG